MVSHGDFKVLGPFNEQNNVLSLDGHEAKHERRRNDKLQ
jgi:hypothetical protein